MHRSRVFWVLSNDKGITSANNFDSIAMALVSDLLSSNSSEGREAELHHST